MATATVPTAFSRINEADFPQKGGLRQQLEFMLHYAIRASSFYDSQPWQFEINDELDVINIYADRSRWLKTVDPSKREMSLSLGCAMENLLIAIDYFGLGHKNVAYFPDPNNDDWAARITIGAARESVVPRPRHLLSAINHSHTFISSFKSDPISQTDLSETLGFIDFFIYEDTAMSHRVTINTVEDAARRKALVEFFSRGDVIWFSNSRFRSELSGLLSNGQYYDPVLSEEIKNLKSDPDLANKVATKETAIVASAPMLGILCANFDDLTCAVKVGQTYERIALEAKPRGIGVYPMCQLIELPEMRARLNELIPDLKGIPQMVFAMGYIAEKVERELVPRIPLEDVIRHH